MNSRRRPWIVIAAFIILAWIAVMVSASFRSNPPGGIRFMKDDELKARMIRVMARREAEPPAVKDGRELHLQKLYDGALVCFAEAARSVWPDLDVTPLERCHAFETERERTEYRELAARLIGNTVIDKPEDITYWLNKETLSYKN